MSARIDEVAVAMRPDDPTRADAMLDKGDVGGYGVWRQVLKAVEELLREEPREGERVN